MFFSQKHTFSLDQNNFPIMASLDRNIGLGVLNIELLKKRLDILGIPANMMSLI